GMVEGMAFDEDEPSFYFCNLGETHYPYMLDGDSLPHISGVHGVFKRMDDELGAQADDRFFDETQMHDLHAQQVKTV
ncbi:metalloenzyme, partial [Enterococcus hirae]